jgi:hypothetical protein
MRREHLTAWDGCGNDRGNWGIIPSNLTIEESAQWAINYCARSGNTPAVDSVVTRDGWDIDAEVCEELLQKKRAIIALLKAEKFGNVAGNENCTLLRRDAV